MGSVTWRVTQVARTKADLEAARASNDLPRWNQTKHELDVAIDQARRALERTVGRMNDASPATRSELVTATSAIATDAAFAQTVEPPLGYTTVAHEEVLLTAVRAEGPGAALDERLGGPLAELQISDLRALRSRIASPRPNDRLASAIWELGTAGRDRVSALIHDLDRAKARARVAALRAPVSGHAAPTESLDTKLLHALDASEVEHAFVTVIEAEDFAARRALAQRLRTYRPGNGDAFAARFQSLTPALRTRILKVLDHEKPRDAVHARDANPFEVPPSMLAVHRPISSEQCHSSPSATVEAEVESSLGPAHRSDAPHAELDRFNAAVVAVAPTYHFVDRAPAPLPTHAEAAKYLEINAIAAWDDLRTYLAGVTWPELSPGLEWQAEPQFADELARGLRHSLPGFSRDVVLALLYPHDLFAVVDALRPEHGRLYWVPAVGLAIGQLVQRVAVASLARVGPRIANAADEVGVIDPTSITVSHPMDRFVVAALRAPGVVHVDGRPQVSAVPRARTIRLAWQGQKEPGAWNWVRAEPADATAEEVISQLAREPGGDPSWFTDALAVAPPLFGVPAAWARQVPGAAAHMPRALSARAFDLRIDTPEARLVELARHDIAQGAAVEEAGGEKHALSTFQVLDVLDDCTIQLTTIEHVLVPWNLSGHGHEALARIARTRTRVAAGAAADVATWGAIATGQRRRLHDIGKMLGGIEDQVTGLPARDRDGAIGVLRPVVQKLAAAAATSHLPVASDGLFADAVRAQADLGLNAVQAQILDVAAATGSPTTSLRAGTPRSADATDRRLAGEGEAAIASARVVQDELINGRAVTASEIDDATLATRETALRSRLNALFVESGQLQVAADEAGSGASGEIAKLFSARFRTLQDVTHALRLHLDRVNGEWFTALQPDKSVTARKAAFQIAEKAFEAIRDDHELMKILADGQALIHAQQLRRLFVSLAGMIVVAVVSQSAAGMVAAELGSAFLSLEGVATVGELSATARAITTAGRITVGIAGNTVGQALLDNKSLKASLIDNLTFAVGGRLIAGTMSAEVGAARATARALEQEAVAAGAIERRIATFGTAALDALGWTTVKASEITGETLTNVALANLATRLQGEPGATPVEARDLFFQALSVSVGRAVHTAIGDRLPGLERLAKRADATAAERRLIVEAVELDELARALAHARVGHAEDAIALLAERTRLLERELAVVEWRARWLEDPHATHELDERRSELHDQLDGSRGDAMVAVRMHLIGLEELVPGRVWKGTAAELHRAATELAAAHTVTQASDPGRDVTRLTVDGRVFEVHLRPEPAASCAAAPRAGHELSTALGRVPGSALRGTAPGAPEPSPTALHELEQAATEAMPRITGAIDANAIEALSANRFAVTLRDGTLTVIDVSIVRIEDHDVARLIPNSSRDNRIGDRTAHGEHVIQLSSHVPTSEVERALAHAAARLIAMHQRAQRGSFGDGPRRTDGALVELSAEAIGRLAELRVLVRELATRPEDTSAIRREILALADHLGAVGDEPAVRARRAELEDHLAPRERDELERAGRGGERDALDAVREMAREDIAAELTRARQRGNDRPSQYDLVPGERISREELARFAAAAQRLRSLESDRTLKSLRAEAARLGGRHPRIDSVQLGGGAALAGRLPKTLLVDQRGRWQADGSVDIAQTAQQLGELYKARFGDIRQVAGPKERVPLDAIRFWEDSLAAMGPVIDGAAAPRWEGDKLVLDITPADGSEMLTIEVGGVPTVATGFVPEAVPGAPRMNMVDVMTTLESQLQEIIEKAAADPEVLDAAQAAQLRLRAIARPRATDGGVSEALNVPHRDKLEAALRARDTSRASERPDPVQGEPVPVVKTKEALAVVDAAERWHKLVTEDAKDGVTQVSFGDEANLEARVSQLLSQLDTRLQPTSDRPLRIVMAGAGGTAVSAAGIILARPNTIVTMLGRGTPAGLNGNPQFTELAAKHSDASLAKQLGIPPGDARLMMFLDPKLTFEVPRVLAGTDGVQTFEAYPARDGRPGEFVGDAYVVSAGRAEQTPQIVSDLILQTTRAGGTVKYRANFDADKKYTGYTVILTLGAKVRELTITGAASRYIPIETLESQSRDDRDAGQRIRQASGDGTHDSTDVPAATGGFPGGFAGSSIQGQRNAARDNLSPVTTEEQPRANDH